LQRPELKVSLNTKHDIDWVTAMNTAQQHDCVPVPSDHPLYLIYTSGTTGNPKGVVRDSGGYATAVKWTMNTIYNARQGEAFWAASDVGWVVGHSYIVYGPLLQGCTTVLYEVCRVRAIMSLIL
jgi:propionyl-CoA synthetase